MADHIGLVPTRFARTLDVLDWMYPRPSAATVHKTRFAPLVPRSTNLGLHQEAHHDEMELVTLSSDARGAYSVDSRCRSQGAHI